jgi:hypothetical protein
MCMGCWEDYDSPRIDTEAVRAAAKAIAEVYEYSCVGGNLHVAIDDWNLDDDTIGRADGWLAEDIHEATAGQRAAERRCLDLLKALSEDERASALGLYDGFWEPVKV